jgi:hypothetical protein
MFTIEISNPVNTIKNEQRCRKSDWPCIDEGVLGIISICLQWKKELLILCGMKF